MSDAIVMAKRGYVAVMRMVRHIARPFGALDCPADPAASRTKHWLQSLLAIYDIDELIRLDVPWWTYDAIGQVEAFLASRDNPVVFEYGSGASTVWLAKRAHRVISVDHDRFWLEQLRPRLAQLPNVTVELAEPDSMRSTEERFHSLKSGYRDRSFRNYVEAIEHWPGTFDLIVVDGRARPGCLAQAVNRLSDDGIIVFDNSHRSHYRQALLGCGMTRKVTRGLVPSLPFPDETTLLRPERLSGKP